MADAAYIQKKIYYGYGQAAKRLGLPFDIYHAPNPINPISSGNLAGSALVSFNVSWEFETASKYGNAIWQTLINANSLADGGCGVKVNDYLVGFDLSGKQLTYFTIDDQLLLPILSVECNKLVTITRASQSDTPDSDEYSGYVTNDITILAQELPVSILYLNKGMTNPMKLPTDTRLAGWTMLLPNLGDVIYKNRDMVIDELNMRYVVVSTEKTDFGWRMVLEQLGA